MFLSSPSPTPYDWTFQFFGYPVRVHWSFWLIAAALGYNFAQNIDRTYFQEELQTPGTAALLIIWVITMFVSIFIHELGHCLAMAWYGIPSRIVLYYMGGLAIPEGMTSWRGARIRRPSPWNQFVISAAGPAAQLLFAAVVIVIAVALGYHPSTLVSYYVEKLFGREWISSLAMPQHAAVAALIEFSIYPSIMWALLNLIPVLPLDGGRIAQSLFGMFWKSNTEGLYEATILSIALGAIVGLWRLQSGDQFMGLMFIMLAASNFQTLQSMGQRW